ncbi:hypothetical protein BGZ80_005282 [Entomortierella chlamydospora]|uniref:FAD-binding domain-containing protein n=1 Tax=Entomortierella chlamydospora TaxID=101097 RepID=A0A9P6MZL3_9FUNG|nr:hypothetical protein BGZ80_005282 [Entomortierella chlamydospora]
MPRIQILIAGGGLGGLALAIMLEHLPEDKKVDYLILERSLFSNPLGSAISLHASIIPLLKQIGIWKEVERVSKPMSHFSIKREDGSDLGTVDFVYGQQQHEYSYYGLVLARPDLHEILLSHVPPEKILTGKRVVTVTQDDIGVSCHCSDSTIYHGDILIGADGAYSAVRQSLYRGLRSHGNLPRQDFSPIKLDQVVVVGITEPMNQNEYPMLKEDVCQFRIVLGGQDRPYTMWMVPLTNNRIAWSIGGRSDTLSGSSFWSESQEDAIASLSHSAHQHSRFPDWGEAEGESIEQICEQMRSKLNPFGNGTYGDLIDKTQNISRVMFEEKGFTTWYGGRTVLIGDGVVNAIFDGACLVNLIHDLPSCPSMQDLAETFQSYFARRYPVARIAIEGSSEFAKLFNDQTQVEQDGRVVMFNTIPQWLQRWTLDKTNRVDPKLDFTLTEISRSPLLQPTLTDDSLVIDQLSLDDKVEQEKRETGETTEEVSYKEP